MRRGGRVAAARLGAIAAGIGALAVPASAFAAESPVPTAQAVAAHAEFLEAAPAPPAQARICVVDSGADLTPDTSGAVVGREAIDGGPVDDQLASKHGTDVVSTIAAAANGWGTVGIWPRAQVYSVRALKPGETLFRFDYYGSAVIRCLSQPGVKVVEIAIGRPSIGGIAGDEIAFFQQAVAQARAYDVDVVAGAGNDGGPVNYPARYDGLLAVGASDSVGDPCSFSSRGDGLDLSAPGCGLDMAFPDGRPAVGAGTSFSSALVAGVIAALRSYDPSVSAARAEHLLLDSTRHTSAGPVLDVAATFRAAGLGALVERYRPEPPQAERGSGLPRPVLGSITRTRTRIRLRLVSRPRDAEVRVRFGSRRIARTSRGVTIRSRRWRRLTVRFFAPSLGYSPALRVAPVRALR